MPDTPTRPASQSILDYFLMSADATLTLQVLTCKTLPGMFDHFAVELILSLNSQLQKRVPSAIRSFAHTNWDKFRAELAPQLNLKKITVSQNLTDKEIDEAIILATDAINSATRRNTKLLKIDEIQFNKLPHEIMKHLKVRKIWRRNLKRNFHKNGNRTNTEYKVLISRINCLSTLIRQMVEQFRSKELTRKLADVKPDSNMLVYINRLTGRNRSKNFVLTKNNENIGSDARKVQILAESFLNQLNSPSPSNNRAVSSIVDTTIKDFLHEHSLKLTTFSTFNPSCKPNDPKTFLSLSQLAAITKSLNGKKSTGPDDIANIVIKNLPRASMKFLLAVFNNCINNGYFPTTWKVAKIIAIKKKGGSHEPQNFRPVSLLSNLGKLFEKVWTVGLVQHCDRKNIIPNHQFGFRTKHGTQHALSYLHDSVSSRLNVNNKPTVVCALDLEKAFDSVWVNGLTFKLISLDFPIPVIRLIISFFEDRHFYVSVRNDYSDLLPVTSGVPQGSISGPTLYNIFTADAPIPESGTELLQFADDTLIFSSSLRPGKAANAIEKYLTDLCKYYQT